MIGIALPQLELLVDDFVIKYPRKGFYSWIVLMHLAMNDTPCRLRDIRKAFDDCRELQISAFNNLIESNLIIVDTDRVAGRKTHTIRINRQVVKPLNPIDSEQYLSLFVAAKQANRHNPLMSAMGLQTLIAVYHRGIVKQNDVVRFVRSSFPQNVDRVVRLLSDSGVIMVVNTEGESGSKSKRLLLPVF